MSLTPLTEEPAIHGAFASLKRAWEDGAESVKQQVGWQGGSMACDVYWRHDVEIWALFIPYPGAARYWCAFGTQSPKDRTDLAITCEINPPQRGINRRCSGLFAEDAHGAVSYLHSGGVGGGRPGIGKTGFIAFHGAGERARDVARWSAVRLLRRCPSGGRGVAAGNRSTRAGGGAVQTSSCAPTGGEDLVSVDARARSESALSRTLADEGKVRG